MKKILLLMLITTIGQAQNVKQKYLENETVTYQECIDFYKNLEKKYSQTRLMEAGKTDVGLPLHLFVISGDKDFDFASISHKNKAIVFINNGIHAGEPCGVDACLSFSEDLLNKKELQALLEKVVVCIVPFYNIDGGLNRGCCSRANQNGPKEHGFRGNARNLDLNRDFIKCDAKNTRSLIELIQLVKPHVFIDTHISNGADYSYNMTLIVSQHNKMHALPGNFLTSKMVPAIYADMKLKNNEMCPYVNTLKETPDSGLVGFLETPRFATGYTALYNILGFVTEAHMLKPYPIQVKATYDLLITLMSITNRYADEIISIKKRADDDIANTQKSFALNWVIDTSRFDLLSFKGYEAGYKKSNISGLNRLYYDRNKSFIKAVKYFNYYNPVDDVEKPKAYLIPQAWSEVINLLQINGVKMTKLERDSNILVKGYYIENYKTTSKPYEGHYLHSNIEVRKEEMLIHFHSGDYLIPCNQTSNRFIVETLEPKAIDSYFSWNFFDSALQQKEWFSDYVYEETAEKILKENPELQFKLNTYVKEKNLHNNHYEQLSWIFRNAPEYEKSAHRYPVFRIEN
ncbi:MAG: M14 family zinc carboxypeptidase [Bacteroidia bacterium]